MTTFNDYVTRVEKVKHGYGEIRAAAEEIMASRSVADAFKLAKQLYTSDAHQARMLATFILGACAAQSKPALKLLRDKVARDSDWRVQEILAQAFDRYCKDTGYETVLPVIEDWLCDPNPNVRRAVSEGLRIWTARPYFRRHPEQAVHLLSQLKTDDSDYVRRSAGNALRDVSRNHADLVRRELARWDDADQRVAQVKSLAGQFLR